MAKRAVVLAGGGSRGAYQIGVWQAIRELKVDFDIVTGTSVGALNGAMMVQGDYEKARALWENLTSSDVVNADFPEGPPDYEDPDWQVNVWGTFIKKAVQDGGLDFSPLEELMKQYASEERLRASDIDYGIVAVEYPSMKPNELARNEVPEGQLSDYIVASAACFPAFKAKEIGSVKYIDGSYQDYMPVNLAVRMGAEEVVAVDLKSFGIRRRTKKSDIPVRRICSRWDLGPFLLFEPTLSKRNIALGYLDAMKAFGKMEGDWYAFPEGEWEPKLALAEEHLLALTGKLANDDRAIAKMGKLRLLRTLEMGSAAAAQEALILPAAEMAGRLLKLDPTVCRSCAEFDRELLQAFRISQAQAEETLTKITDSAIEIPKLIDSLRREGKQYLLQIVYEMLDRILQGKDPSGEFWALALAAPSETAAACYLLLLKKLDE